MMFLARPDQASAQRQKKIDVRIEVVDGDGFPVGWSNISSSKNRYIYTTDDKGVLNIAVQVTDVLKVSAAGYTPRTFSAAVIKDGRIEIILEECSVYEDDDHQLYTVTGD